MATTYQSKASKLTQVVDGDIHEVSFGVDGAENVQMYTDETHKTGPFTLADFYQNWTDFKTNSDLCYWGQTEPSSSNSQVKIWYNPVW